MRCRIRCFVLLLPSRIPITYIISGFLPSLQTVPEFSALAPHRPVLAGRFLPETTALLFKAQSNTPAEGFPPDAPTT